MFLLCEYTSASISCPMYFFIVWNIFITKYQNNQNFESSTI